MIRPWLLPGLFSAALALLCGMTYLLNAGLRTWNRPKCWRCGVSKVRPSKSRSSDLLAAMFLLRPYRCGGCLTRFYGFRTLGPGVPVEASAAPAEPMRPRRNPFRIHVKVIIRLPRPADWKEFLLAEEQGY